MTPGNASDVPGPPRITITFDQHGNPTELGGFNTSTPPTPAGHRTIEYTRTTEIQQLINAITATMDILGQAMDQLAQPDNDEPIIAWIELGTALQDWEHAT